MKKILVIGSLPDEEVLKWKEVIQELCLEFREEHFDGDDLMVVSTGGKNLSQLLATVHEEMRQAQKKELEQDEMDYLFYLVCIPPPRKAFFGDSAQERMDEWRKYFFSGHIPGIDFDEDDLEVIAISDGVSSVMKEITLLKENFPDLPIRHFTSPFRF